jgi:hypothetical protein
VPEASVPHGSHVMPPGVCVCVCVSAVCEGTGREPITHSHV